MDLIYNVTESFYTVYQLSRRVEIVGEQVAQNEESYATAKGKFDAGLIPEVEVLQSDVDLAGSKNDLLSTQRELARAKNAFRLLLGVPTEEDIATVGEILYQPVLLDSAVAVESALKNRSEVLSAERQIVLAKGEIGMAKSRNDFHVDLTARYGLDRNDTLFNDLFHDFNRSRSAALTLSVPLFDWEATAWELKRLKPCMRTPSRLPIMRGSRCDRTCLTCSTGSGLRSRASRSWKRQPRLPRKGMKSASSGFVMVLSPGMI